jgi:presenilin-like A22 family membrane protease
MKHNWKITILILSMFIMTQFIGLYVVNYYSPIKVVNNVPQNVTTPNTLPYGLEPPPDNAQVNVWQILLYIIPAFIVAIAMFFVLTRFKAAFVLKAWFFIVVIIALSTSLIAFFPSSALLFVLISLAISIPLAFFKIYRQNLWVHNITELFIYPGIAAVFVALLSGTDSSNRGVYAIMALLILISFYDIWAVWHSGIMQKMAKYQINKLKIFGGFIVPSISRGMRLKIKKMRKEKRRKGIRVNFAILGGGDVIFPIIAAGVVLRRFGFTNVLGLQLPLASIIIVLGATLGIGYLLFFGEKKKFYPAMPFISIGIFLALAACYLLFG